MLAVSPTCRFLMFSLVMIGLLAGGARATTFSVPSAAAPSIGAALSAAMNGDTIVVADGTYNEQSLTTQGKALTLRSLNGPNHCLINAQQLGSVFIIQGGETASTIIQGFTLENGKSSYGSGINMYRSSPTITNCIFSGGAAANGGGGVYVLGGSPSITGCTFQSNTANAGGGVFLEGVLSPGTPTLINCTFMGNVGTAFGGGLYLNGGSPVITNCTFTSNSAGSGSGAYMGSAASPSLTNTILYGDAAGGEIVLAPASGGAAVSTPALTDCDVQGGFAGTGNLNADPLFASAAEGDFHLRYGSPCLGKGSASAPAYNGLAEDGSPRPSPPAIGALEAAPLTTHVLWNNGNMASLWNYSTTSGAFNQNSYGPYPGWTAAALADGGDGLTRLLWDKMDGTASIWSLNNTTGSFTQFTFGPYAGWTATAVSVGVDGTTHVLWTNANTASIWNYSTADGTFKQTNYGPYANYSAKAIADGPDGKMRVLWDKTDGTASIWSLDNTTGVFTFHNFGPFTGYTASGISVALDGTTHLLWNNVNGTASVWNYSPASGTYTYQNYGPYAGFAARSISDGYDGKMRVLWSSTTGATSGPTSLWSLDNAAGIFTYHNFGPYSGWTATAVSAGY